MGSKMQSLRINLAIIFFIAIWITSVTSDSSCVGNNQQCSSASDCCSELCVDNSTCAASCRGFECPEGQRCYLNEVQCKKAPCPPQRTCFPEDPCTNTSCGQGLECRPFVLNPHCRYPPCPAINGCYLKEDPCQGLQCSLTGQECFLTQVQCFRPPCPPLVECAMAHPCQLVDCSSDRPKCVEYESYCDKGDSKARCVPEAMCIQATG